MKRINHRDVNAELFGRSLLSVQAQLMLLRDEVNEDARLSARLDPTQSDECRLLSLDIGRKLRTINDWIHDIRHEYGVELRPLVGDPAPSAEQPATVEGEVIDAAQ
jgi:3'-phosphoadenosine 5'-phosphosulfate sulfotransferase (PAPS reductase)/FAD synthetase